MKVVPITTQDKYRVILDGGEDFDIEQDKVAEVADALKTLDNHAPGALVDELDVDSLLATLFE